MEDAEGCDEVIIIAKAKIVAQGPPSKLEKRLPGHGKIVNIILDNITDDLVFKIGRIYGVKKIISEGRNLKIIMDEPNAVKLGQKIDELGGVVNKTEITSATMKEVFVYFTGEDIKE
jgi:ABC-type multidrug transport system ATPase subunit